MRSISLSWAGLVVFAGVAACGVESSAPSEAPVESAEQPIIGGDFDNTTQAAVAVGLAAPGTLDVYGVCTGSLIKVDYANDVAYVLTAAHCASGDVQAVDVRIGNDWRAPDVILPAAQVTVDENYAGFGEEGHYDFAVIALRNLPQGLPTPLKLPSASDGLSVGDNLYITGYGNTVGYGDPNGRTRRRKGKTQKIQERDTTRIIMSQPNGGLCDGDSGGPAIKNGDTVVGVASYVGGDSEACHGIGVSARVSSGLGFINSVLTGQAPPPPDACFVCRTQAQAAAVCAQKNTACENNNDCAALLGCLQAAQSSADQDSCLSAHPGGVGPLIDWFDCPCADACAAECGNYDECKNTAKCGIAYQAGSYNNCMESKCCAEMDAAGADSLGYRCLTANLEPAGCSSNAAYQALKNCSKQKCESTRGSSSGGKGGSSGSSGSEEEEPEEEEEAEEEAPAKKKAKQEESGCNAAGADASWSLLLAAIGLCTRRRKPANAD